MALDTRQARAREHVYRMVSALGRDDLSELEMSASELTVDGGEGSDLLYLTLAEMTTAIAQMVRARAGEVGPDTAFVIQVADEDGTVDIDELPPPLRALVRAVLAALEGHGDDASFQLAMAAEDPRPQGRREALVHGSMCLGSLLDEQQAKVDAPMWLASAADRDTA